jgi:hypothetical protein
MRYILALVVAVLLLCGAALAASPQAAAAKAAKTATVSKPAVPFVENDYAKALAGAQKRNVPIFVELWAPW